MLREVVPPRLRLAARSQRAGLEAAAWMHADDLADANACLPACLRAHTQPANAHVGNVKEFHTPSAPKAPVVPSSADLAKELQAYESEVHGSRSAHACNSMQRHRSS